MVSAIPFALICSLMAVVLSRNMRLAAISLAVVLPILLGPVLTRIFWMLNPEYLKDTNIKAATTAGLSSCQNISMLESYSVTNVHSFSQAIIIANELKQPVVFRQFRRHPKRIWSQILEKFKATYLLQPEVEIKSFGNMFMAGTRTHVSKSRNVSLAELVSPKKKTGGVSYYASFAQFLTDEAIQSLIGLVPEFFTADTNFISNFETDVIASPLHSTTYVTSYSLQLVGRKLWVWVSPEEMERIGMISTHTANFHYQGSETDYFTGDKESENDDVKALQYTLADEGDLLIFPPLWGHSVTTQAGPNVMLNLRQRTLMDSFLSQPLRFLETIASTFILGNTQHKTAKFNAVQQMLYRQREAHYEELGWAPPETLCKGAFLDILNRK